LVAGNLQAAEESLTAILAIKNNSARALCGLAKLLRAKGSFANALAKLDTAVAANPNYLEAYRLMLDIHEELGNGPGVLETATKLHAVSPENPRYTLLLAKSHLDLRELDEAEKYFRRSVQLSPKLAQAYKGLGNVYMAKHEYQKAMKTFTKALDLDAGDVSTLNSLGMTYVHLGQIPRGLEFYAIALKINPSDYRVLFNLGQAHEKDRNLPQAKWYYTQAMQQKPGYDRAIRCLRRIEHLLTNNGNAADYESGEEAEPPLSNLDTLKKSS